MKAEKYDRTEQPVVDRDASHETVHHHKQIVECSYSARNSGWDDDKAWSSQEWKADKSMDDRTEQPVVASWARTHEFQSSFSHEKTKHVILVEEETHDRTGQPVVASWARTHEFQSSFSHEKTKHVILVEEETHDRMGTPVVCPQRGAMPQQFIIGDHEAELELSLGSRSFLDKVNDQVRKRQKRPSMNVTENDEKAFCDVENVHVCNIGKSAVFM